MTRAARYGLLLAAAIVVGHVGTIIAAPRVIMHTAMHRLAEAGGTNRFLFGERTTPAARRVVKPSPDLAYASCVYDLSHGPLLVSAAPSPDGGYVSVSVFDARSDNIAVFDTIQYPQGIRFVLAKAGQPTPGGSAVVLSRSDRGVILDRRLAPTAALFAAADKARQADRCAPIAVAQ